MRKVLIIVFGCVVALILLGIFGWNMLPSWISHQLSSRAKVDVSIQDIHLGTSSIEVDNIRVGNPPKTILEHALLVRKLRVDVPFSRFFDDRIVIEEMLLNDVYLGIEFDNTKSSKGNWSRIMKNLKESTGKEKEKAASKGDTKSVLIRKLILTNVNVDLAYTTGGQGVRRLRTIERLELNNISSEGGIPTAQIMDIVISEMLKNIFSKEGLKNMLDNLLPGGDSGGSPLNTLKGLFSDLILLDNDWEDFCEKAE